MIRKQVYLEERQDARLKQLARLRGVSEAEVIREALDGQARRLPPDPRAWEEALSFMRAIQRRAPVPGPRVTREELYEDRLSRYDRDSD